MCLTATSHGQYVHKMQLFYNALIGSDTTGQAAAGVVYCIAQQIGDYQYHNYTID